MRFDAGIVTMKLHALLGGVLLRFPDGELTANRMPATATTQATMMMALRFILNRHRCPLNLYNASWAVPVCAAA